MTGVQTCALPILRIKLRYNMPRQRAAGSSMLPGKPAGMAELADAPDLGSGGRPCRFESCYPHAKSTDFSVLFEFHVIFRVIHC